jgi:hypothetical protein
MKLGKLEICWSSTCAERERSPYFGDSLKARQRLQGFLGNAHAVRTMRSLLARETLPAQLWKMSDHDVIEAIVELLVRHRCHLHDGDLLESTGGGGAAADSPAPPPLRAQTPFPLAERRGRASSASAPVNDPPTFPSNHSAPAQAAVLVAAAQSGAAFCPL